MDEKKKPRKKKRARRTRSSHPGVVLVARVLPSGTTVYRARYTDARTGRVIWKTLDAKLSTHEKRATWANDLSLSLARERQARAPIEGGGVRLADAVAGFLERPRVRDATIATHRAALAKLTAWAETERIATTADVTRPGLARLRDSIASATRRTSAAGGGRGEKATSDELRSPFTVNREIASIRAALNHWRVRGELALSRDEILDTLALEALPKDEPEYLSPAAIGRLLAAAVRHDVATFDATREEHAGDRVKGATARHLPIAHVVALLLLTGMRRGEALSLQWSGVDLEALDASGAKVGEIRLTAAMTKTKRGRTIGLEVSPALRRLLGSLRLRHGGVGYVLGGPTAYTPEILRNGAQRLVATYGAPAFTWQILRSTCATYLTNAPGIFGAASVFLSARQLGHSVAVAERHYLNTIRGISRKARTLEAAMQCEDELGAVLDSVLGAKAPSVRRRKVRGLPGATS